jgi:hypothetical protein
VGAISDVPRQKPHPEVVPAEIAQIDPGPTDASERRFVDLRKARRTFTGADTGPAGRHREAHAEPAICTRVASPNRDGSRRHLRSLARCVSVCGRSASAPRRRPIIAGIMPGRRVRERRVQRHLSDAPTARRPRGIGWRDSVAAATGIVDGDMQRQLGDADPRPVLLWRWHLAEEYEHRSVAHDVLKALYGRNPITFYWLRVAGFVRAARHIGKTVLDLARYLFHRYEEIHGVALSHRKGSIPPSGRNLRACSGSCRRSTTLPRCHRHV